MRKAMRVAIPLILILALVSGCATLFDNPVKTSFVTLNTSHDFYMTAMSIVVDLQGQGLITQAQRDEINRIANIYYDTHNLAGDALEVYAKTDAAEDKEKLLTALALVAQKWANLAAFINEFIADDADKLPLIE
jgi:hypothetical protein